MSPSFEGMSGSSRQTPQIFRRERDVRGLMPRGGRTRRLTKMSDFRSPSTYLQAQRRIVFQNDGISIYQGE